MLRRRRRSTATRKGKTCSSAALIGVQLDGEREARGAAARARGRKRSIQDGGQVSDREVGSRGLVEASREERWLEHPRRSGEIRARRWGSRRDRRPDRRGLDRGPARRGAGQSFAPAGRGTHARPGLPDGRRLGPAPRWPRGRGRGRARIVRTAAAGFSPARHAALAVVVTFGAGGPRCPFRDAGHGNPRASHQEEREYRHTEHPVVATAVAAGRKVDSQVTEPWTGHRRIVRPICSRSS
jgi:hypothetical protein